MDDLGLTDPKFIAIVLVVLAALLWYWKRSRRSAGSVSYKTIQKSNFPPRGQSSATQEDLSRPKILFLVASQTGTAEEYARRLAKDAQRLGFRTKITEMNDCEKDELPDENFVFIVASTYGEGDPPDNSQDFYTWIMDEMLATDMLSRVKYTVFSLGNKTYQHYQAMGRKLDARFRALGATPVFQRGEGDDDGTLEDDFVAWTAKMWPAVCPQFGLEYKDAGADAGLIAARFELVAIDATAARHPLATSGSGKDAKSPYLARVLVNRELHRDSSTRSCRHMEFDISGASGISYAVGDHLGVYPENDPAVVSALAARMGVDLDAAFTMRARESGAGSFQKFHVPCTYRDALTYCLEINAQPRKPLLRAFAEWAQDPTERAQLLRLSEHGLPAVSSTDSSEQHVTSLSLLQQYASVRVDVGHWMELVPQLAVRYYSISSSPKFSPTAIHITAVVTGVCTSFFRRMSQQPDRYQNTRVRVFVRPSTFRLPTDPSTPVIMVGPGTGLAPFRGFIQERADMQRRGVRLGPALLFFGCRHPDHDYIYEEELKRAQRDGVVTELLVAFSRLHTHKKTYVQHLMEERGEQLWRLLSEQQAHIYICGDAKAMAKDVAAALHRIAARYGGHSDSRQTDAWMQSLTDSHRMHQDVW